MKERPILFSGPMVRALLDGSKTQTRRVVKLHDLTRHPDNDPWYKLKVWSWRLSLCGMWTDQTSESLMSKCPYGQPGDRLWVKETHRVGAWREDGRIAFDYAASPELTNTPWCQSPESFDFESAWAGWSDYLSSHGVKHDDDGEYHWEPGKSPLPWRPSIHMFRWASRITLDVTGVRVERLQDISEEDARAEGSSGAFIVHETFREDYMDLWESINGPGSWDLNPYVWVIEFKRVGQ